MRFRALGPVQVWDGTSWVGIRAPQQRTVLAILLTQAGRVVSTERLVDEIWPDGPPRAAVNTIQTYMLRLRRLFDGDGDRTLVTKATGTSSWCPAMTSISRCSNGLSRPAGRRWRRAGWRPPRSGCPARSPSGGDRRWPASRRPRPCRAEAARLELHRVAAFEDQAEARLTLGRHGGLVDELRRLVQEHPFRERLLGQLMLALYRCGRPLDALETYRQGRRLMRDELGVDP